jgi:alpha/beta superfamily hydrolase
MHICGERNGVEARLAWSQQSLPHTKFLSARQSCGNCITANQVLRLPNHDYPDSGLQLLAVQAKTFASVRSEPFDCAQDRLRDSEVEE